MILANVISSIVNPFANVFAWVLSGYFSFTHSYGLSIILLTLTTMVIVFPLTRAGTRSMMRMQLLQPELVKIRARHKMSPGMSAPERQEARLKLNEEMMALYRENGVNPTGGCLPMFMQFPIFIVLYDVIRGMTHQVTVGTGKAAHAVLAPQYIPKKTALYHAVISSNGHLNSFGLNLADSVRTPQSSWIHVLPYAVVILIAVVLQYVSIWQITNRNPSAQINPQMQAIQKFMPLIFVFLYIVLPAGVGIYFIVSSLFRVGQQEYMYKHDPKITAAVSELRARKAIDAKAKVTSGKSSGGSSAGSGGPRKGFMDRLREAAAMNGGAALEAAPPTKGASNGKPSNGGGPKSGGSPTASKTSGGAKAKATGAAKTAGGTKATAQKPSGGGSNGAAKVNGNGSSTPAQSAPNPNRSRDKRRRRP